jgi:acyl carrier protein
VDSIKEKIRTIMAELLEVPAEQITDDTNFFEDFDADSMVALTAVVELERNFGITIPDNSIEQMRTFSGMLQLVKSRF